jgi:phosphoglycerol transferase MdoB-like AlkP superfamily enzyme
MDLSVISYILVIPLFFFFLNLFLPGSILDFFLRIYHFIVIAILTIIQTGDVIIYHFLKSLLNWRALSYLAEPMEAAASVTWFQTVLIVVSFSFLLTAEIYLFRKYFIVGISRNRNPRILSNLVFTLLLSGVIFTGMRGGLQKLPINESSVYYSSSQLLNFATVNGAWHLIHNLYGAGIASEKSFVFMERSKADAEVRKLLTCDQDSYPRILKTDQPNVVILILESYTADVIEALGGEKELTPNFNRLVQSGILFTNIYASGTRTDQGIVSVLSGFPATPNFSIMRNVDKSVKLPSLSRYFLAKKYSTSFYYGGKTNFSNLNSYLFNSRFEKVIDEDSFNNNVKQNSWGVHDEYVLLKQLSDMDKTRQPFFSVVMTLSSHPPFDIPGEKKFPMDNSENKFRNVVNYTDRCLGKYFEEAEKKPWFTNTLFILVADHGVELPRHNDLNFPKAHHIPLLFYGNVLKNEFRGITVTSTGGHHDIAETLARQLGEEDQNFKWSKNLFNSSCTNFAYYELGEGFGWIEKNHWTVFLKEIDGKQYSDDSVTVAEKDTMRFHGKAFVQKLFREYLDY